MASFENGILRITFEKFGPSESIVFESDSSDQVVRKAAGTSASPSTLYVFSREGKNVATIRVTGYEDLSNARYTLLDEAKREVRSFLYME